MNLGRGRAQEGDDPVSDSLRVETANAIATITLNRPESMNAVDADMAAALAETFAKLEHEPGVRVVILRGAGSAFMAGGDLKPFHDSADRPRAVKRATVFRQLCCVNQAIETIQRMPQPVIASVHGAAVGFGLSLVLACDLAVAAEGTRFSTAYLLIGTTPDGGATHALPRTLGLKKAMEVTLLAEMFDAKEAAALGLVNRVVAPDQLEHETRSLAERLACGPALAIARSKQLLRGSPATGMELQLRREMESFADCAVSDDFTEGVAAFVEKRKPKFG
jgi:2-(1,2-epoxy-1,2-dihydrophenyl)acetyl-CoA isomerase